MQLKTAQTVCVTESFVPVIQISTVKDVRAVLDGARCAASCMCSVVSEYLQMFYDPRKMECLPITHTHTRTHFEQSNY